jgi:hypothetical protein
MIGKDTRTIKIGDDPFGQMIFDIISKNPEGTVSTVDYKFQKPGTIGGRIEGSLRHPHR